MTEWEADCHALVEETEMSLAEELASGWISHFWAADHQIEWLGVEEELSMWLAPNTLLVGRIDQRGRNAAHEHFFAEDKTANPRKRKHWKKEWKFHPQSLTYGILVRGEWPDISTFTVRMAFKSTPPTYDHCWYSYKDMELSLWAGELIHMADEIRALRAKRHPGWWNWPLNPSNCMRYGPDYACPFLECACSKGEFDAKPPGAIERELHLDVERNFWNTIHDPNVLVAWSSLVILDATRVQEWLGCREKYRRMYEENIAMPENDDLKTGKEFHALLGEYYRGLIKISEKEAIHG